MQKNKKGKKYILLVGDGMADYPLKELGEKTPLEVAKTPNMDRIASCRIGQVKTIPEGMQPGSDIANLSLLGYDPGAYHTGRSPLEAASMGVKLKNDDIAFRMNLVTLGWKSDHDIYMRSHSSGDISTEESKLIVEDLKKDFVIPGVEIYCGVAYRHLFVWEHGPEQAETIPPHDFLDQNIAPYLNKTGKNPVPGLIRRSWRLLENHPVNIERRRKGLKEANSIWLWGQGKAPKIPLFHDKFGLSGGVISAVDLLKGIGIYVGFEAIPVEGATGYLDTNFAGKAEAALKGLERFDFLMVHVEAPDEAGHEGNIEEKIKAIEAFDEKVVGVILSGMDAFDDFRIMVASDHYTPIIKRTHTTEPAPFAWAGKDELAAIQRGQGFSEESSRASGLFFERGFDLMPAFLGIS
ncbi:MAG TPA: cofactor-independent phosphoglycerate mutase [Desulfobacteraceae bacterium]|nr:cofactor-independent phosphoglycerate mutase [Desulfobacteraceae bacterium]HPJ68663.1 cofactor-independent phosphoglycerate mutase [Desulfobacteraceae bacterium]HPQ29483.1 cofactor-independent phosphoglycerate mutase [Desulfobacteraceae bacterium]